MIVRKPLLNTILTTSPRPLTTTRPSTTIFTRSPFPPHRSIHLRTLQRPVPTPTPFVPDVPTFLTLIGRSLSQHASKFPSWESLFQSPSQKLRDDGIEPARARRYLLWWRERFRRGEYGVGGDLTEVVDGVGQLRIAEREGRKIVVNARPDDGADELPLRKTGVDGIRIRRPGVLVGSFLQPVKGSLGSVATLRVQEGLWEVRRGLKVKGGERKRKAEERAAKRRRGREEREHAGKL